MAPVRYVEYLEWKKQAQSFASIVAYRIQAFVVSQGTEPERIRGERVDPGYFEMLGVQPMLGRGFAPGEYSPGAPPVLVLSEEFWRRTLNGRTDVIGTTLRLDGVPATVIGVMPGGLRATIIEGGARLWTPLIPSPAEQSLGEGAFAVLARLKPDVALSTARAEMAVIAKRLADQHPEPDRDHTVRVDGLQATLEWAASAPVAKVLIMAVVCLLLISCVNVSCLLLGRAAERRKEVALRSALGAGRGRLVRQFLSESLVFALAGGVAGVGLASLATAWCTAKIGPLLANDGIEKFAIDGRVLAFALLASLATAIIFGVLPALRGSRVDVAGTLKEGAGGFSAGTGRMRLTGLLVTVEVALSVVLVTSGGLLLNSIREYWRFDWGIPLDHRMAMQVTPIERNYDTDSKLLRFYSQLLARAQELPGVESAALVNSMPLHMGAFNAPVRAEGPEPVQAGYRVISPGYHSTAGLGFRAGRAVFRIRFRRPSSGGAGQRIPGRQTLARRERNRLARPGDGTWRTVVGITADIQQGLLKAPNHEISVPYMQAPPKSIRVLLRVPGDPATAAAALRRAARDLDPDLPLGEVQTLRATKEQLGARFEFIMALLCSFAVAALVLAVAGIYGVTSRAVAIRTREIGIRIALGRQPSAHLAPRAAQRPETGPGRHHRRQPVGPDDDQGPAIEDLVDVAGLRLRMDRSRGPAHGHPRRDGCSPTRAPRHPHRHRPCPCKPLPGVVGFRNAEGEPVGPSRTVDLAIGESQQVIYFSSSGEPVRASVEPAEYPSSCFASLEIPVAFLAGLREPLVHPADHGFATYIPAGAGDRVRLSVYRPERLDASCRVRAQLADDRGTPLSQTATLAPGAGKVVFLEAAPEAIGAVPGRKKLSSSTCFPSNRAALSAVWRRHICWIRAAT